MVFNTQAQTGSSPVARLIAYIQKATDNMIVDIFRRKGTVSETVSLDKPVTGQQDPESEGSPLSDSIADSMAHQAIEANAEFETIAEKALAETDLTTQQRILTRLILHSARKGHHITDKELAEILRTTEDTVKTQRHRAWLTIRQYFEEKKVHCPEARNPIIDVSESTR